MQFTWTPPRSAKARQWLERRASQLNTLNPVGRRVFLKSSIALARKFGADPEISPADLSIVLRTLKSWLSDVREAA